MKITGKNYKNIFQPAMFVSYVVGPTAYLFLDRLKPDLLAHTMDNISVS
jgi:hypothetical protein